MNCRVPAQDHPPTRAGNPVMIHPDPKDFTVDNQNTPGLSGKAIEIVAYCKRRTSA
jgi:hypothetical protein